MVLIQTLDWHRMKRILLTFFECPWMSIVITNLVQNFYIVYNSRTYNGWRTWCVKDSCWLHQFECHSYHHFIMGFGHFWNMLVNLQKKHHNEKLFQMSTLRRHNSTAVLLSAIAETLTIQQRIYKLLKGLAIKWQPRSQNRGHLRSTTPPWLTSIANLMLWKNWLS